MKKLLIVLSVSTLFLMSGCTNNSTDTLSCSSTTTANGVTTKTKYDIDYKDDDVKYVTITYDYSQDNTTNNTEDDNDKMDGVDVDTDGIDNDNTNNNDGSIKSDDVVDGVVGDAIDGTVDGIKETILDLAGIKNRYENQLSTYDNIEGFSYKVDIDSNTEYKIIYKIDMDKISDADLTRFDVTRDFSDIKANYEGLGYTCQ
ncbi:MAG: hypothetical protein MR598_05305 [Erysipelotrichaceae bacterium]|nr:hypothetical protein [Erysipelotrichaceae bacterium]